jgi:hypothetical protein
VPCTTCSTGAPVCSATSAAHGAASPHNRAEHVRPLGHRHVTDEHGHAFVVAAGERRDEADGEVERVVQDAARLRVREPGRRSAASVYRGVGSGPTYSGSPTTSTWR